MRALRLDHVALAVADLDAALALYQGALGLRCEHREAVADQRVEVALLRLGESAVELIAPTAGNVGVAKFLADRGPGLHHLALAVEDLPAALAHLRQRGLRLIDDCPRRGARGHMIAFVHPQALGGALVELLQA